MKTIFLGGEVWPELTRAAKSAKQPCDVAVAYFGKGASRLLPLPPNSRLVVNASEQAVKSGQTCPAELLALHKKRVAIHFVQNLHAKVFVLGKAAFVGSANASINSSENLVEAVVRLTDPKAVLAAREFVRASCADEMLPEYLSTLQKMYRPPMTPGGTGKSVKHTSKRRSISRVFLAQTGPIEIDEDQQTLMARGDIIARKRMEQPRRNRKHAFLVWGKCSYLPGDIVVVVELAKSKSRLVSMPGKVLHVEKKLLNGETNNFVYLEQKPGKRRSIDTIAGKLGHGAKSRRSGRKGSGTNK